MHIGLLAGILWALDTVILGVVTGLSPFVSTFLHDACSAIWMLGYTGIRKQYRQVYRALKTRSGRFIMLGALLGGPVGMSGYVAAIQMIGPAYTAIISAMYPALGAFLAWIFLKEKMRFPQIAGLIACIAGVIVMGYTPDSGTGKAMFPGFCCALLCCVGWASEAVICAYGMKDPDITDEHALQIRQLTSAVFYGVVLLPLLRQWPDALEVLQTRSSMVIAVSALAGTSSYLCYYKAIARTGAAKAMALNITYSAWAIPFSLLLLGTLPDMKSVLCGIVIILGALAAAVDRKKNA